MSNVDHPDHYHAASGIEVIDAIEAWNLGFSLGNAVKYIARADRKEKPIEDLQKAMWYIRREIELRKKLEARVDAALVKVGAVIAERASDGEEETGDD